jgi:release factor glutamine methyltransferase
LATTVSDLLEAATARLETAGVEEPRREARLLLALALGLPTPAVALEPKRALAPVEAARFERALARRAAREPYSRIAGKRGFWNIELNLSPDTFDPRPDSETLIEAALAALPDRRAAIEIVDFGTGTGALLLALLSELPNASGIGVDILPGAVAEARRNAAALGLARRARFLAGDWGAGLAGPVSMIISNPPYIESEAIAALAPEVALWEPRIALDGGPDGVAAYRRLAADIARLLRPSGLAVLEIGAGQGPAVTGIIVAAGLQPVAAQADLSGLERALVFRTPG